MVIVVYIIIIVLIAILIAIYGCQCSRCRNGHAESCRLGNAEPEALTLPEIKTSQY